MFNIMILTSDDFTDPEKADQCLWAATLKNGDIKTIEQMYNIIVYNNKYVKCRAHDLSDGVDLNQYIKAAE